MNMVQVEFVGTSERLPQPEPLTRRQLRDLCKSPATRPQRAFKGPGRLGWMITPEDLSAYLRGPADTAVSVEAELRAAGFR